MIEQPCVSDELADRQSIITVMVKEVSGAVNGICGCELILLKKERRWEGAGGANCVGDVLNAANRHNLPVSGVLARLLIHSVTCWRAAFALLG